MWRILLCVESAQASMWDKQQWKCGRDSDGIGEYFPQHSIEMGLDLKKSTDMEELLECLGNGLDHPPQPPHPPMKLCVVVVVEPSTMEMFQTSTNTCTIKG